MGGGPRKALQREAVSAAARDGGRVFSVDDLAKTLRGDGVRVGLATVYRAVARMLESGEVQLVGTRDGRRLYAPCGIEEHHHHAVCVSCGNVSHTECPLPEEGMRAGGGFHVTGHELTLYGLCSRCSESGRDG